MDLSKRTWRAAIFDKSEYGYGEAPDIPAEPYEANIVCSDVIEEVSEDNLFNDPPIISKKPKHMPVIDIDVKATLIPSTTPGHSHLYIDHEVEWDDYLNLLKAMAKCGIVEEGYVRASEVRGYTAVRLPWIRKVVEPESEHTDFPDDILFRRPVGDVMSEVTYDYLIPPKGVTLSLVCRTPLNHWTIQREGPWRWGVYAPGNDGEYPNKTFETHIRAMEYALRLADSNRRLT